MPALPDGELLAAPETGVDFSTLLSEGKDATATDTLPAATPAPSAAAEPGEVAPAPLTRMATRALLSHREADASDAPEIPADNAPPAQTLWPMASVGVEATEAEPASETLPNPSAPKRAHERAKNDDDPSTTALSPLVLVQPPVSPDAAGEIREGNVLEPSDATHLDAAREGRGAPSSPGELPEAKPADAEPSARGSRELVEAPQAGSVERGARDVAQGSPLDVAQPTRVVARSTSETEPRVANQADESPVNSLTNLPEADGAQASDNVHVSVSARRPAAEVEKFAAPAPRGSAEQNFALGVTNKKSQAATLEKVEEVPQTLGTAVAKPKFIMPTARSASLAAAPEFHVSDSSNMIFSAGAANGVAEAPPMPAMTAHRAVEAVFMAVDQVSAERHGSVVTLQFSVGGSDLAVRVQMRGDEVHTTFRTESPELRAVLAHEWTATAASFHGEGVRLAEPVFTAANANAFSFERDGSPPRQGHPQPWQEFAPAPRERSPRGSANHNATVSPRSIAPRSSGRRLETFA